VSKPRKTATKSAPKPGVATAENVQPTTPETLTAVTLKKGIMTIAVDELKNALGAWHELSEAEQEKVLHRLDAAAADITTRSLELFATSGIARVCCTLESITVKDGIKGVISLSRHDVQRHDLMDAQGQTIWVVLANPEQFADAPHGLKADADQKALDLNAALDKIAGSEEAEPKPSKPPGMPDASKPVADPDAPADPDTNPDKPNP
jgi:hypothetical protein